MKKESESLEFQGNNRLDGFHTDPLPIWEGRGDRSLSAISFREHTCWEWMVNMRFYARCDLGTKKPAHPLRDRLADVQVDQGEILALTS